MSQHSGIRTSAMRSLGQVHTRGSQQVGSPGSSVRGLMRGNEKFSNAQAERLIADGQDEFNKSIYNFNKHGYKDRVRCKFFDPVDEYARDDEDN